MTICNYNYLAEVTTSRGKEYMRKIEKALRKEFGESSGYPTSDGIGLSGDTYVDSFETEERRHKRMVEIIAKILPVGKIVIKTHWMRLDARPCNEYTTEVEE